MRYIKNEDLIFDEIPMTLDEGGVSRLLFDLKPGTACLTAVRGRPLSCAPYPRAYRYRPCRDGQVPLYFSRRKNTLSTHNLLRSSTLH